MPTPEISIVIPCYDRITLLERTLAACLRQQAPDGVVWEIIVADNHPDQLAAPMVARLAGGAVPVRHVIAGERNIAAARNAGVAAARGRLVAFVDDDEAPEPGWLAAHYTCHQRTGADATFGPKYPVFEGGHAPSWDPAGAFYTTDFRLPPDTRIHPLRWWPPQPRGLGTGNSMLRRDTCLAGDHPFDEVRGASGGEDTLLLLRLALEGRSLVWCPDARVLEFNETGRLNPDYMARRVRRSGRHSLQGRMSISKHPLLAAVQAGVVGLGQAVVYGILWRLTGRMKYRMQMNKGIGKIGLSGLDFIPEGR